MGSAGNAGGHDGADASGGALQSRRRAAQTVSTDTSGCSSSVRQTAAAASLLLHDLLQADAALLLAGGGALGHAAVPRDALRLVLRPLRLVGGVQHLPPARLHTRSPPPAAHIGNQTSIWRVTDGCPYTAKRPHFLLDCANLSFQTLCHNARCVGGSRALSASIPNTGAGLAAWPMRQADTY